MTIFTGVPARQGFQNALGLVTREFLNNDLANSGLSKRDIYTMVRKQVFDNTPEAISLFELFVINSQNRSYGVRISRHRPSYSTLKGFFLNWDFYALQRKYPRYLDVCADIVAWHSKTNNVDFISRDVSRHISALRTPQLFGRNPWVRFAQTIHAGAVIFSRLGRGAPISHANDLNILLALCGNGLPTILLPILNVADLWAATSTLISIPNIQRQLALNFLKDAGVQNCVKPDLHLQNVAGAVFNHAAGTRFPPGGFVRGAPFRKSVAAERTICRNVIDYAHDIERIDPQFGPWRISVAAVDRLLWLIGSGRLYIHQRTAPRAQELRLSASKASVTARIANIASVL